FSDKGVGLANARLSIIDIEGGHQPISNEDGSVHVTYNGEIYNYRELREQLQQLGHNFRTQSDTEVIVHGYEQWGENFVTRLNGMFGIALWDSVRKKLILARDRMGIKPVHYAVKGTTLFFGSEVKAILQAPIERVVNRQALYMILNLSYTPGEGTLFEGIRKLPPASYLAFEKGSVRVETYWSIPPIDSMQSETHVIEKLEPILEGSIRAQMVADVPVGCFLSGGLDTSVLVAYASKASHEPLKTFCMGFGEATDEFKDANVIAQRFGTDHHELTVDSSQAMKLYPKMIWHMEAPKYNLYPWFVCELVRKHVKVCLSGNGGDEIFGGYYQRYQNALRIQQLSANLLSTLIRAASAPLRSLPANPRLQNRLRVLRALGNPVNEYLILAGAFPESFNQKLFKTEVSPEEMRGYYEASFEQVDFLQGLMNAEIGTKLVDDLLSVDDTMSMANSLELRVPLIDNRIVDVMATAPWQLKYAPGTYGKLILRKIIGKVLPERILQKPKWGFSVDVRAWYKGELGELIRQVVPESDVLPKYFDRKTVHNVLHKTTGDVRDRRFQVLLWQLLGFHFWHKIFIESKQVSAAKLEVEALAA
ncbi:MAG TPA: asparagine synthase (glutamine-hydrolyzing), partial [Candidatus Acidoferrales bacterium]|nr:asparagine synthase (glutamine-hydrolyzing) [Candidatus Acidoferrales bacterium]